MRLLLEGNFVCLVACYCPGFASKQWFLAFRFGTRASWGTRGRGRRGAVALPLALQQKEEKAYSQGAYQYHSLITILRYVFIANVGVHC